MTPQISINTRNSSISDILSLICTHMVTFSHICILISTPYQGNGKGAYVGKMPPQARPLNTSAASAATPDTANTTPAPPRDPFFVLKMDGPLPERRKPHAFLQYAKAHQEAGSQYIPVSIASTSVPVRAQKQLQAILTLGMLQDATAPIPSSEIEMAEPSQSVPVAPQRRSRAAFLTKLGPVPSPASPSVPTVVTPPTESASVASATTGQRHHTPGPAASEQSKHASPFKPLRITPISEPKESAGPTVCVSYFI